MRRIDIESRGLLRVRRTTLTFPFLRTFYESSLALIESGVRELLIDLSDVTYVDSASLGCLMDICRTMARVNGVVKLIGLQERVRAVATLAGMSRYMEVPDEESEITENPRLVHDCSWERIGR